MNLNDLWIVMPLLILACGALAVLLLGAVLPGRHSVWTSVVCCGGAALWTVQAPPLVSVSFGLTATPLSRAFILFFCLLAAAVLILSLKYNEERSILGEEYPATILFATTGMVAMAGATNLLTLFLGLEAMTFGFYILVAMDLKRDTASEAGLKYLLLGAVSTGFLAFGLALLYFTSGTLESTQLLKQYSGEPLALVGWGFILIGIAFKLSLVPAHLWTPDVYQGATAPVAAFLSGGSKFAAILFTVVLLSCSPGSTAIRTPLLTLALLSMILGNLAALQQTSIRRMLAYSSIAQMGYVALALLAGSSGGFKAALFYGVVYAVMSLSAFGAVAVFERSGLTDRLEDYRGGGRREPFTAALLALSMFALAGIPPTAGFTGKFMIFAAALRGGETIAAIIGILTAAVSAYYYLRVVVNLYMKEPATRESMQISLAEKLVLGSAALLLILFGLFPMLLI